MAPEGGLDLSDPSVAADLRVLQAGFAPRSAPQPVTALARLVQGLDARRKAFGGPLAVVPCDNLPSNGDMVRQVIRELARYVDEELVSWIDTQVSFVSTSVDRITPRLAPEDVHLVAEVSGWDDKCPVVTEPFMDWILCGDFPAGRPEWELAGARFVEDIRPFEQRKLRMLNGAHTLLATAGRLLGHQTVASAAADPVCAEWLEEYWDETERHLPGAGLDLASYREKLRTRFLNPRIEHRLEQIAEDTETKLRLRIVPTLRSCLEEGAQGRALSRAIAAWAAPQLPSPYESGQLTELVSRLDQDLAGNDGFLESLAVQIAMFRTLNEATPGNLTPVLPNQHHDGHGLRAR